MTKCTVYKCNDLKVILRYWKWRYSKGHLSLPAVTDPFASFLIYYHALAQYL